MSHCPTTCLLQRGQLPASTPGSPLLPSRASLAQRLKARLSDHRVPPLKTKPDDDTAAAGTPTPGASGTPSSSDPALLLGSTPSLTITHDGRYAFYGYTSLLQAEDVRGCLGEADRALLSSGAVDAAVLLSAGHVAAVTAYCCSRYAAGKRGDHVDAAVEEVAHKLRPDRHRGTRVVIDRSVQTAALAQASPSFVTVFGQNVTKAVNAIASMDKSAFAGIACE